MAGPRVILTPSQIDRVKAMAAVELPLETVARQLGMARETLANALIRQGLGEWMEEAYPCRRGVGSGGARKGVDRKPKSDGEMRKLKPEQIVVPLKVPESLQAKWLMGRYAA